MNQAIGLSTHGLARSSVWGAFAFGLLLSIYFVLLTLISGWSATASQFAEAWYFILALAAGLGIQVALFVRLRQVVSSARQAGSMLAANGATSTVAMISCCSHYLVNLAPILGATGLVTLTAQYQVELFWVGLAFNAAGIAYVGDRLLAATKEHAQCHHS